MTTDKTPTTPGHDAPPITDLVAHVAELQQPAEDVPTDVALSVGRRVCDIAVQRKAIARERASVTDVHRECLDRLAQLSNAENELNARLAEVLA